MQQIQLSKIRICYNVRGTRFLELWKPLICSECSQMKFEVQLDVLNEELKAICMDCWNDNYEDGVFYRGEWY